MPDLRRVGLGASLLLFVVAPSARLFAQEPLAKRLWPAVDAQWASGFFSAAGFSPPAA